ncbi:MAG: hypothetical protein C0504_10095 [Candidatus Solibacter sp.]|nr:hypothetical protein [Candidatus Solibacter sp.]
MKFKLMFAAACAPAAMMAWQGYMAGLGITQGALKAEVEKSLRYYSEGVTMPWFGPKTSQAAKALSEQNRAAAVREILGAVKGIVMSPAFMEAHAAYIKQNHKAADHGIKVQTPEEKMKAMMAGGEAAADEATRQAAAQMAQMLMNIPAAQLAPMFESDLSDWERQTKSRNAKSAAAAQKLYARAKALQPLITSDAKAFQKGYALLKSMEMGGTGDLAAVEASGVRMQQEQEQEEWNKYNLKAVLRTKLNAVVKEAATVDFAAQTVQQGNMLKFANPAYERKSYLWKAMYRAGKAPAGAMAEFARAWLKEL